MTRKTKVQNNNNKKKKSDKILKKDYSKEKKKTKKNWLNLQTNLEIKLLPLISWNW